MERNKSNILVKIPSRCASEVRYVFHCLLNEFLGVDYIIQEEKGRIDFSICLNNMELMIKNHFFTFDSTDELYQKDNIPAKVQKGELEINGKRLPIVSIFGEVKMLKQEDIYVLDTDIISSTFFMLTRWEEYANKERDKHNRFAAKSSLAYKEGFLDRPIVNEYVELLWELIKIIGYKKDRKRRQFTKIPTHDEDIPFLWNGTKSKIKSIGSSGLRNKSWRELKVRAKFIAKGRDPYDTHDFLMDLSEKKGLLSNFFFMAGGNSKYDNNYRIDDPRISKLIGHIKNRGHNIGLHPSYNAYNNSEMFKKEKKKLEEVACMDIKYGRHHYLRFDPVKTLNIWNDAEMEWDSTLSYADSVGFRCGICFQFPFYDILSREQKVVYERPLIVMDGSLFKYENNTFESAREKIIELKNQVKKFNGDFVFLWHNSSFNNATWLPFQDLIYDLYD